MTPNTPEISPLFLERMSRLLGEKYLAFAESLKDASKSGLRVDRLKRIQNMSFAQRRQ
jgi:hypothetical protein